MGIKNLFLAPMDDITDSPFRILCRENGATMAYSEFVATECVIREIEKSKKKMSFSELERPIGIQIFGDNVESMKKAALMVEKLNPDEININCGCPAKKIVNKGGGAALLRDIDKLVDIVKSVKEEVNIPVTVKTRLGWNEENIIIEDLILRLQDIGIKKVIVHARTRQQLFGGEVRLDLLKKIKENKDIKIEIIGNGDVKDFESLKKMEETGVDGIMIGRAAIGNPWIFDDIKSEIMKKREIKEIAEMIKRHINLACDFYGEEYGVVSLKKHYSGYFKGIQNSKNIRVALMSFKKKEDIINFLDNIIT